MPAQMEPSTVRLPPSWIERLREQAEQEDRSAGYLVRRRLAPAVTVPAERDGEDEASARLAE